MPFQTVDANGRVKSVGAIGPIGPTGAAGAAGAPGSLVLLASQTASASASLSFTTRNTTGQSGAIIQSDYDEYLVEVVGLVPATDNVSLLMNASTNGGSSYDTGANYGAQLRLDQSTFSTVLGGNSGKTAWLTLPNVDNTATQVSVNLSIRIMSPSSTSLYKVILVHGTYKNNDGSFYAVTGMGVYLSTTAVDAFQFIASAGNLASGVIRCYGVAK